MISTADIHWLAGFLDGEGYFGMRKSSPVISVSQKEEWPLLKVQKLIGGNLYLFKGGCKPNRFYYTLHINKGAIAAMMTLFSLLSPRRQEKIEQIISRWKVIPRRGDFHRSQTHCHRGHEFSVENTYIQKGGGRDCIECRKIHQAKYSLKLKSAALQGA